MKVLLANKFYYPRGGDCIYTIELEKLLQSQGHDVSIFTQQFNENLGNDYCKYWPSGVNYSSKKLSNLVKSFFRPIYSKEVKNKFQYLLNNFKPDIIHLNNIHSQLSPIIAEMAYRSKIPVVWTLHDYKLLCPSYICLRKGEICEQCFRNKLNVIRYRCVKNIFGSTIAYLEAKKWSRDRLEKYTSLFIAPSKFMRQKMVQGGFNHKKIAVLNNFIEDEKISDKPYSKEDYYLYFGRFSEEKGINTLLKVASKLPYRLKLAGSGPIFHEIKAQYDNRSNIELLGFQSWNNLKEIIKRAQFCIIPSEWYENYPLSIIESFALGTPVIGANIGGIPELINENETGFIFESGNEEDLRNKIDFFYKNIDSFSLGIDTITFAKSNFRSSAYYNKLLIIYNSILR